ncbi:hypothetical protein [Actinomadura sp. DC4]|uniref:hypothetical protein n=1 Tax=Actinomadura sp. DC4 TaxID=3055069 RepID=UPI0025AFC23C|nr:hypothetical protein [Actinomadura sp. DC4]MDN3353685.1 hypothetical protein [Actinomadura sp. DC4]
MSEDLEALLREHYRRAAERIVPGADLVERGRAARPSRARTWPRVLAAAAAIAVVAAVTWGLLRPAHRHETPATPPAPATRVPSPSVSPMPSRTGILPVPVPTRTSPRRHLETTAR